MATTPNVAAQPAQSPLRKWGMLVVLSLALAIIVIDTTLLNVSLGTIIRELNTDIQSLQWVITSYSLTLAALTITGGRLGDFFGRKRMFMLGAFLFAAGSLVASFSQNVTTLIIGESLIEGIGAALMMPATSSLLVANFRGRDRAIAFGIWGGIAAAASAIGPILGGYLTSSYSWRWGFRINVVVVILLLLGSMLIPESHDEEEKPAIDFLGVLLSSVGMLLVVFGVIESSDYGWWMAKKTFEFFGSGLAMPWGLSITPAALVLGVAVMGLFLLWQRYLEKAGKTPLVSLHLFQNRQYTTGILTSAVMSLGMSGLIFSLPVFLQSVRGFDALHTGLALLPMSITLLIVAPLSAVLSHKTRPKYIIQTGLFLSILGYIVLHYSVTVTSGVWNFAPGMILFGMGMGMVMSQINNFTLSAVSVQEAGEASGVSNTMRQVGTSFGSAIIGAALLSGLTANMQTGIEKSAVIPESNKVQIGQSIAGQISGVEFGGSTVENKFPAYIGEELSTISKQATTDATRSVLSLSALFAVFGFLVSFLLPNVKNVEKSQSAAGGH